MYKTLILFFLLAAGSFMNEAKSQKADTIIIQKNDTIIQLIRPGDPRQQKIEGKKLEEILEEYSERSLFSRKLHEWLVKSSFAKSDSNANETQDNIHFSMFSGKYISNIDIRHIPPFGGSVNDTVYIADSWLARAGNRLRFETASGVILKTITFDNKDSLNPTDLYDSERLLRSLPFINDARIVAWPHLSNPKAVNISIYVQDRYPHALSVGVSDQQPSISLMNKNLMGRGISLTHTLVTPSPAINEWGFRETLGAENFPGKYVNIEIDYSNIYNRHFIAGHIEKEFVLPEIKYAGGATMDRSFNNERIEDYPSIEWEPPLNYRRQNFWVGRSFLMQETSSPLRSNIYLTTRFMDLKLFQEHEKTEFIPDGKFYYAGIAFSRQDYYKNNLIHSFGRTEDVPYGSLSSLAYGYHQEEESHRHFLQFHHSFGKALIPSRGYLFFSGDIGSFFRAGYPEQGYLKLSSEYITPLIPAGESNLRNFIEIEYVNGLNRLPGEYLFIDEYVNGLHRFDYSESIRGTEKIVLKTEQVFFTQMEPLGFKFAVFSFFDTAFLRENPQANLMQQKPYFSFGGGLRIRNDNLVFNTLQIRLAIMPRVPPGNFPLSLRITGESPRDFRDFVPSQPGTSVFY